MTTYRFWCTTCVTFLLLVTLGASGAPVSAAVDDICVNLTSAFNSINNLSPIALPFKSGEVLGIAYPAGQIIFDSKARQLGNCRAYTINTTDLNSLKTSIAHLQFQESLVIHFNPYKIENAPWDVRIEVQKCFLVIHYQVTESPSGVLNLTTLMGEIKDLGPVTIRSNFTGIDGKNITLLAEDIIRPKLLHGFDWFAKNELVWVINPEVNVTSTGLDAVKSVFKGAMLKVDKQVQHGE